MTPYRSKETVLALIRGIDVANNFAFSPHRRATVNELGTWDATPVLTLCNDYVNVCTAALGCPIAPVKANEQHEWLMSTSGQIAGWMHVDSETARQRTESGYPTVASWFNPSGGHGHIAMVVPADPIGPMGIYVSSAGSQNYVRALLSRSFGDAKPDYFTHN